MPVEIRELVIKGLVNNAKSVEKKFNEANSKLYQSRLISQLRKEILDDCKDMIKDYLDRENYR